MFRMQGMVPYDGEVKTLKLKRDPFRYGMGYYEDINGVKWDVNAVVSLDKDNRYVCARPVQGSYYGTGTYDSCAGFHEWPPYRVEVVTEEPKPVEEAKA